MGGPPNHTGAAAAWIDPSLITKRETRYMTVDLDRGAGYGNTLTWAEQDKPKITVQPVEIQFDFYLGGCESAAGLRKVYTNCRLSRRSHSTSSSFFLDISL